MTRTSNISRNDIINKEMVHKLLGFLIFPALLALSACGDTLVSDEYIVTEVNVTNEEDCFENPQKHLEGTHRYRVEITPVCGTTTNCVLYTNTLYLVGDTVSLIPKRRKSFTNLEAGKHEHGVDALLFIP